MCGISAIAGKSDIAAKLLHSIKNLEYRGYDSCGMAVSGQNGIVVRKNIGTVEEVNKKEQLVGMNGNLGIAHTRWATHGGVSKENSHPHTGCTSDFTVVHNGIVSNYKEIRKELEKKGHKFTSETDTEVIPHLVEEYYKESKSVENAVVAALRKLKGTYAFALITSCDKGTIYCAKNESPLVIGIGDSEMFVGSDVNAFIDFTKNIVFLNNGEYAIVNNDSYVIKDMHTCTEVSREIKKIEWDAEMAKKGGYPHFMLKEIYEQPNTVLNAMKISRDEIQRLAEMIHNSDISYFIGIGTTYYVGLIAQYYFSKICGRYIPVISSDEFENVASVTDKSVVIAISQSGETYDTLRALRFAKERGAQTAAIVNVIGSSMSREVDFAIMQGSGPEICVLSTKAALAQIVLLMRTAIEYAIKERGKNGREAKEFEKTMNETSPSIERLLNEYQGIIRNIAYANANVHNWLYLGRGIYYPVALEAALKMKEVTYLHAEGMPGGFMKHGTISLIDESMNSLVFVPPKKEETIYELTLSGVEEIRARKGKVIGIHFGAPLELFDESICIPEAPELISPLIELVAGQLFAYYTATALKRNVDKPRSLAKSVTVA
ncbi:MAG: glutamine--fructose-6-phosphate transaminase (isomerizing) [Candidatus Schekmanbacteria bacterium]|nr:MAG: glutamine--fructose-6-phosphate transaminase (isomerizing) [Candidatus Schekmanbacteria bacterium]